MPHYKSPTKKNNRSIFLLALLCLTYYLVTTYYPSGFTLNTPCKVLCVEIEKDSSSTIISLDKAKDISILYDKYHIPSDEQLIRNGDKLKLSNKKDIVIGNISGIKSMSLGIPIRINSASADDIKALPGIGYKLAARIVAYRDSVGGFQGLGELQSVDGIGKKKLNSIKEFVNLD